VQARLEGDGSFDARDLEVVVHHGAVALSGTVADEEERVHAVHVAETVRGVVEVVPRIRLR
jgi:osmotically-inducible protein OsmY